MGPVFATRVIQGISAARKALFDDRIAEAQEHVTRGDSRYFAKALSPRHQWRLYEWLRERALYLDIETDSFGQITVVGLYGLGSYTALVRNESLGLYPPERGIVTLRSTHHVLWFHVRPSHAARALPRSSARTAPYRSLWTRPTTRLSWWAQGHRTHDGHRTSRSA